EGIGLRGYGQNDPLVEYKKESFTLFQAMMDRIEDETIKFLYFMQLSMEVNRPPSPFEEVADGEQELYAGDGNGASNGSGDHRAAKKSVEDFTRNIQRKKDRELAQLQFVGGDGSSTGDKTPVVKGQKV